MCTPVPVFSVELSPMARQTGVTFLHDVELDAGQELAVGQRVRLRDEGDALWDGVVSAVEQVRFGQKFRLTIRQAGEPG